MLSKLLPREKEFFNLFRQAADKLVKAAREYQILVNDLSRTAQHARTIHVYEREGDDIALLSYRLLHKTFVTPFDRHDINTLTTKLDDILDLIHRLAQRFVIYQFQTLPEDIIQMADLTVSITERVQTVVDRLDSLKNQTIIIQTCLDIDQLENDAEALMLRGMAKLFADENDIKQLLKLKEVYEQSKIVIDNCQDSANLVKSIVLEYA